MARINGSGFKMNKSPLTKNIFKGREGYDPAARRAKLKSDVQEFVGGIKKGVKAVDNKLQRVGEFLSSKSIKGRKSSSKVNKVSKVSKSKKPGEFTTQKKLEGKLVPNQEFMKKKVNKTQAKDINAPNVKTYVKVDESKNSPSPRIPVAKPKTTDLSKTTGVKAPKKAKATAKQQGVLEKQIQKTNKNKPKTKATVKQQGVLEKQITKTNANKTKTKATVKNQGVLEKAITKPKKATVTSKPTSKKPTTTRSKGGRKAGESQYQYSIRMAKANRKLKNSIKTSKKNKTTKKVDLTKKKGLGPRA